LIYIEYYFISCLTGQHNIKKRNELQGFFIMVTFGTALKFFRNERGFSLRDLGVLSKVDHAYIHRLEAGDKSSPSEDILQNLSKALKLNKRKFSICKILIDHPVTEQLFEVILEDDERPIEVFQAAAQASFRGAKPSSKDDWRTWLDGIENML